MLCNELKWFNTGFDNDDFNLTVAYKYRSIYGNKTKHLRNIEANTVTEWAECMCVFDPRVRRRDVQVSRERLRLVSKSPIHFVNNDQ